MRTPGLVICTAGFETLAEAVYLNKPLIIVPSKGHFEQYCNALDALRTRIAMVEEDFNMENPPKFNKNPAHVRFKQWADKSGEIILGHING